MLDWLGKATVLALGGEALAACASRGGAPPTDTGSGRLDAGTGDSLATGDGAFADGGVGFSPGDPDLELYEGWRVRTVDRQDLQQILQSWSLTVDGMVDRPARLSFAEMVALPRQDQVTDFHCVEGWSVYDVPWNGVHIDTLLELVGARPEATHVTFHTLRGAYNESLPLTVAREPRTLLAYGALGYTLPLDHGFPLRLVVPRLLAYKSAKYVERLELTDHPVEGYWVRAGYSYDGLVPEGRLRPGKY